MGVGINAYPKVGNRAAAVATAGTRVQLPNIVIQTVTIRALNSNTGLIFVGDSLVSSVNGFSLSAGDTVSLDISNLKQIYLDSTVNGDGVCYIYLFT